MEIINKLKQELKQEKQKFNKTFADINSSSLEYRELEKIFLECIDLVQSDIRNRKQLEQFSIKKTKNHTHDDIEFSGVIGYENFLDGDKRRLILNFFLSNEVINLIHDSLFLGRNANFSGYQKLNDFSSSRISSGKTDSLESFNHKKFNSTASNILFKKTNFSKQANALLSEVQYKKPLPSKMSYNITSKMK